MYRTKYKAKYGELVLACDAGNNWRYSIYPQYKANRKKTRDTSTFDWNAAFTIMNNVRQEIKENFPYKVLHIDGCEADDVIGVLVENTQEFGQYEDVMIISGDKDFAQLQKFENVQQFSPVQKKLIVEKNPRAFLVEHIMRGDTSDGVPNVLSDDDVFASGGRQTPLSKKKLAALVEDLDDGELLYAASWYRNYMRNKKMIDLSETPQDLKNTIIDEFNSQDQWHNKGMVLPYLINKRCNQLIESVQEFI
jgi:5'-3' exonuclease